MKRGMMSGIVRPFLAMYDVWKHYGKTKWSQALACLLAGCLALAGILGGGSCLIVSASAEEAAAMEKTEEVAEDAATENTEEVAEIADTEKTEDKDGEKTMAPDFTLQDQYGETHKLSEYQGKAVFLNFWATWCPYCVEEMPDIEELYHELGENQKDVVILGVAAPGSYDSVDEKGVVDFLKEHGWTYPVVMDRTGEFFDIYGASSLPTTWLIRKDGSLLGYMPGAMAKDQMQEVIGLAMEEE